jgi:hypothetical protein
VETPRVGPTAVNAVRAFFVRLGAIAEAMTLVDQLKIEVGQARSEVNARDKLLKDAEIALAQRDERLKVLQQQNLSMRQSWSWRMTNLFRITPAKLRQRLRLRREAQLIRTSHLFDAKFYLERNPDVKAIGVDPVSHYVQ